jgi:hypothetical protein
MKEKEINHNEINKAMMDCAAAGSVAYFWLLLKLLCF